ncbi:MAG: beta-lactamase family protein [Streptosporangiaceae bacterium]|nr:beta-lactamase family protein [Streptosporangiaceae bacterium]
MAVPGQDLQISEQMLNAFTALTRKHQVPGAQFAIYHGGLCFAHEIGELEFETGLPVTRDAVFPISSITKSFTATVAMILVADGDVDLDAPIHNYVPEMGDLGAMINLRQLLSHTSGLAESSGMEEKSSSSLRQYIVEHVCGRNLVQPPGTGFSYSNPGYIVAGRLIETVTGMSWSEAVESILLRPLGIEAAYVNQHGNIPPRRQIATGHSVNTAVGRTRPVRQELVPAFAPAGALALSATDLVKLGLIHVGPGKPEVLLATYARQMRQAVPRADPFGLADGWGPGLAVYRQQSAEWVGHDGNAYGTSCYVRINPADGWVVALTSNSNTGAGLWRDLQPELARAGVPINLPRIPAQGGPRVAPPSGCVGQYINGDIQCTVKADSDGTVYLSADGEKFVRLAFHENSTFSVSDPTSLSQVSTGRFVRDPATGKIYGIHVGGRFVRRRQRVIGA